MPTYGQPLPLQNAVTKYSAQSVQGTAVAPATSLGIGLAGYRKVSNRRLFRGPGAANPVAAKQGSTVHEWALRYAAAQTGVKSFLLQSVRSGGVLPYFTLGVGYEDDTSPTSVKGMRQIRDAQINTLDLSFNGENGVADLSVNASGHGGLGTDLTSVSRATLTSAPWTTAECVITKATVAFPMAAFQVNVNHNISTDYLIPGAAPGSFQFGPSYFTPHGEAITGSITLYQSLGIDLHANTVTEQTLLLVLTSVDDSTVLTISLPNCSFGEEQQQQSENGIRWTCPFESRGPWSLT